MIDTDYSGLGLPVIHWTDVDHFCEHVTVQSAVHVIGLSSGNHLDVLVRGLETEGSPSCIPVFFSGAIPQRRGTVAPYFSGLGMARTLGTPIIALSDPALNVDDEAPLGWYAGTLQDPIQADVTRVLRRFSDITSRGLLLIGGSGGGFAALFYASQIGARASALAWNPQSDLLAYTVDAVGKYLVVAGVDVAPYRGTPEEMERAGHLLRSGGIQHALPSLDSAGRYFVLQNATDWHVEAHFVPLVEAAGLRHCGDGYYSDGSDHGALLAHFGDGHAIPSQEILQSLVVSLSDPATRPHQLPGLLRDLGFGQDTPAERLPRDLRGEAPLIEARSTLELRRTGDLITASVEGLPPGYGGMKYRFVSIDEASRRTGHGASFEPLTTIPGAGVRTVEAVLHDGFGRYVTTLCQSV